MLAEGSSGGRAAVAVAALHAAFCATFLTLAPSAVRADEALARTKQCGSCHDTGRKRIGPSWDAIAARYRGRPEAAPVLAVKIRAGGAGSWGAVPMPANTQVDEAEARRLVGWILARPAVPGRP